ALQACRFLHRIQNAAFEYRRILMVGNNGPKILWSRKRLRSIYRISAYFNSCQYSFACKHKDTAEVLFALAEDEIRKDAYTNGGRIAVNFKIETGTTAGACPV